MARYSIHRIVAFSFICLLLLFSGCQSHQQQQIKINTWTIVAADPISGDVGVAGASCVPNLHVDAVAALVPGVGAAAVQADFNMNNRNLVFQLIQDGIAAGEIIQHISNPAYDRAVESRQYGVVTIVDGRVSTTAYTGAANIYWAGDLQDEKFGVSVQGNSLADETVVRSTLEAFRIDDENGRNSLPDRLMRALEAGSAAGGDARCNNGQVTQSASSAFLLVARGSDPPYAARDFGMTEAGETGAPWLAISTAGPRYGSNPVDELRIQYDAWRIDAIPENSISREPFYLILILGVLLFFGLVYLMFWYWRHNVRG